MMNILVLASAQVTVPAQLAVPPHALAIALKAYDEAQVRGDAKSLRALLADDYLLINSKGDREGKSELIADYTAPGFRLNPFVVKQATLRFWEGGAVAAGVARLSGVENGSPFSSCLRFADVWRSSRQGWQVVFTQASQADPRLCAA